MFSWFGFRWIRTAVLNKALSLQCNRLLIEAVHRRQSNASFCSRKYILQKTSGLCGTITSAQLSITKICKKCLKTRF